VHGFYNVGTGIILNDFIGKATLRSNAVQHNVIWMAYGYAGVAALLCIVMRVSSVIAQTWLKRLIRAR
jgi:hypothetical protein